MGNVSIVTGGAGFIGLNLVSALLEMGREVIVIDNLSSGSNSVVLSDLIKTNPDKLKFFQASILDSKLEDLLSSGVALGIYFEIYHLAAQSHEEMLRSTMDFVINNTLGTACVLEAHRKYPNNSKLLCVSTDEVYGDKPPFPTPLNTAYHPSSPYSASKGAGDLLAMAYRRTYNLPIKISRCCNNFGKFQNSEKFIPTIIKCLKANKPVPIYGNGEQQRQWVPVEIHVQRLISFMGSSDLDLHVGGFCCSNLDIIEFITAASGIRLRFTSVKDRPGHDLKYELQDSQAVDRKEFVKYLKNYINAEMNNKEAV